MRLGFVPVLAVLTLLAACQSASEPPRVPPIKGYIPKDGAIEAPKTPCVADFWGNCTPVAQERHAYRWRYIRPGVRSREDAPPPPPLPPPTIRGRDDGAPGVVCHPRRRAVGDEKSSREQAEAAADYAWMGSIRYDYGERYQDLELAKGVRRTCVPSSTSSILKSPLFRCEVEATPCRSTDGVR
jgi:hypothetical protein